MMSTSLMIVTENQASLKSRYCGTNLPSTEGLLTSPTLILLDAPTHNPVIPHIPGIERDPCPFFTKTGCCKFGDLCSRAHLGPELSNTLLFHNMYSHIELEQGLDEEFGTDLGLEFEESELFQHFRDFYDDVLDELRSCGHVSQFKVCCNYEPHLRGNVYVQYKTSDEALVAYAKMNGRYYGGKRLNPEFAEIKEWRNAICGLYRKHRCPKGRNCNFLHVFRNPRNEFWEADRDLRPLHTSSYNSNRRRISRSKSRERRTRRSDRSRSFRRRRSRSRSRRQRSRSRPRYRSSRTSNRCSKSPPRKRSRRASPKQTSSQRWSTSDSCSDGEDPRKPSESSGEQNKIRSDPSLRPEENIKCNVNTLLANTSNDLSPKVFGPPAPAACL